MMVESTERFELAIARVAPVVDFPAFFRDNFRRVVALTYGLSGSAAAAEELEADHDAFWRAVRSLPKRQAMVVALHYADDRTIDEIARILGCAPGTVKTHLHRARAALREALAIEPTEDSDG